LPAGALLDFAGVAAPSGWLLCDGAAYGRTAMDPNPQPTLFAAIGTTWGVGDGVTTFNVPDFRRRTTVGSGGTGTGVLGNAVGDVGGAETHTLVTGEMPNHGHGVNDPGHAHSTNGADVAGGSFTQVACGNGVFTRFQLSGSASTGISVNSTGGGGSHNNIQPSAVVLKIIKA
jgi:microcystin-dependent protein